MDLRWGLTAEDTSDSGLGALEHCLLVSLTSSHVVERGARLRSSAAVIEAPALTCTKYMPPLLYILVCGLAGG